MRITSFQVLFLMVIILVTAGRLQAAEVHISAAASLKESLDELSSGYAKRNPGVKFVKSYGGSGALAKQMENGAPVDIFISANPEWMDYLKGKNLLSASSVAPFSYNTLVFAGRTSKPVSSLKDLLKLDRIAIGSPKSVPAGEYAMEAFGKAYIEKEIRKKLVLAKDVRECLMYAERGEVDGALVYRTDALQAKKVKILFTVPQHLYPRVVYPIALTSIGANNREAQAFYRYLLGAEAKAVLAKYGFASR